MFQVETDRALHVCVIPVSNNSGGGALNGRRPSWLGHRDGASAFRAWLAATGTLYPNLAREISLLICRMTPPPSPLS